MIAALPMYDRPENAAVHDRLWRHIRARLGHGPDRLTRDPDLWSLWTDPGLTLAQTCGLPFRTRLNGRVTLLGAPDNGLAHCPPGNYFSVIVINKAAEPRRWDTYAAARFAYNDDCSHSGWAAPQLWAAEHGFRFENTLPTGAHVSSARAVAEGRADIAALDAVSFALMCEHDAFVQDLQVIARTASTPAPPFIAAPGTDPAPLRRALSDAIAALSEADRAAIHLHGLVPLSEADYHAVSTPPAP